MGNWKVGLCSPGGCINDWKLCLMTYLVPVYVFGMGAEKTMDRGDGIRCITLSAVPIIGMCVLPCWRSHIRSDKGSNSLQFKALDILPFIYNLLKAPWRFLN